MITTNCSAKRSLLIRMILMLLLMAYLNEHATAGGPGTTGAVILSQPIGARASGMAEAYTAASNDVSCLHYNPASLTSINEKTVSFGYQKGIFDDNYGIIDLAYPMKNGTIGGSIVFYDAGMIDYNDDSGNAVNLHAQQDKYITLSYSHEILNNASVGINFKTLQSILVERFSATVFALDIGSIYSMNNLALGISFQNIGTEIKYVSVANPLPEIFRIGCSYSLDKIIINLDLMKPSDGDFKENIGLEYNVAKMLFFRTGYKFGYDLDSLAFGLGINFQNIRVDCSSVNMKEMGSTYHLFISMAF